MIEINEYDRQWLYTQGLTHADVATIEDYISRVQKKYPLLGDCSACMAAYKRFTHEQTIKRHKEAIATRKMAQVQAKRGKSDKSDFQNGVWAPFNNKIYHDEAKMKADAKALGLEQVGNDYDRKPKKTWNKGNGPSMRESLEQAYRNM